jgi:hypothetical protein
MEEKTIQLTANALRLSSVYRGDRLWRVGEFITKIFQMKAKQTATQVTHHRSPANSERISSIVVPYVFSYRKASEQPFLHK